jgi:hypothetical protein
VWAGRSRPGLTARTPTDALHRLRHLLTVATCALRSLRPATTAARHRRPPWSACGHASSILESRPVPCQDAAGPAAHKRATPWPLRTRHADFLRYSRLVTGPLSLLETPHTRFLQRSGLASAFPVRSARAATAEAVRATVPVSHYRILTPKLLGQVSVVSPNVNNWHPVGISCRPCRPAVSVPNSSAADTSKVRLFP